MKLTMIRSLGRYKNIETGKCYNIKKGTRVSRGTDHIFYLYRGTRMYISDKEFYSDGKYQKID